MTLRAKGTAPLKAGGKPMRALRALADADPTNPWLYEDQVFKSAKRDHFDTQYFHDALRTLVERGYAEVMGKRGGQRYAITDEGREVLAG